MKKDLSKIKKIDLRDIWNHEALDFTKWLAEEENIKLLSDEVGVDIKLIQREANVGRYNVDILAEEESTGHKIIIENQLEDTNHDHLGKLLTYASGHDAKIMIWIVKNAREEHVKAIEWLNDITDDSINFFLINIEVWQIDNSSPAPKFQVLATAIQKGYNFSMKKYYRIMLGSQNKFGQKALREGYIGIGYLPHINFSNQFTELLKDFNKKYIPELMSIGVLLETSSSTSQK